VYYVYLPSRLLSWVVTRNGLQFFERSLPLDELRRMLAAHETAIVRRAPVAVVREQAARLFDQLVRPATQLLRPGASLVVIPDGVLQSLPFASLWDRERGRYLVEDYLVGLVPSGTVFVRATAAAAASRRERTPRLLAVGNPRVDGVQTDALPSLRGAEAEAVEVARLYAESEILTGAAATKRAFLEGLRRSQVVHYAGHATGGDVPGTASLLLASEPKTHTSGALHPDEIDRTLPRTRVVVLAGCRTAAGPLSRLEGAFSLARPFLAAGVPSVVASLWDVDDAVSRRFFVAFHTGLLAEGDPGMALHKAQTSLVRDPDPSLAHPASWAGFVNLGGLAPRSLRRAGL
jgi:CHAT domain-containing protein